MRAGGRANLCAKTEARMKSIKAVPLTRAAFRAYGRVLSAVEEKAAVENEELSYWGKIASAQYGSASVGLVQCKKRPGRVRKMERHVKTREILVDLDHDSLICVAKPGDAMEAMKAFLVRQGQAFIMDEGVWHCIPFPVGRKQSRFLVVFASGTEEDDLEVKDLQDPVALAFEP